MRLAALIAAMLLALPGLAGPGGAQQSLADAVAAYRDPGGARVCDPDLDRAGGWADISELENSLYVPYGDIGAPRVMYVLTAPWCPFCRQVLREPPSFLRGIELRLIVGDLSNAADFPRYVRLLRGGAAAVPQMFSGPPVAAQGGDSGAQKLLVDALLLNAHVLQMRYMAVHRYFQRIGEMRAGPFGYPANIIVSQPGAYPLATLVLGQPNLDAIRGARGVRPAGVPADRHWFVRDPPAISPIDRGVYTWPGGVRIHAFPDDDAPSFCFDGRTALTVVGAVETRSGLWAYVEALTLNRASGGGAAYVVHGYARAAD